MTTNPNLVSSRELETGHIEIPLDGVQLRAYLSRPSGGGSAPGVVVIHENRGLDAYARDMADGLASAGYIVVAPDLLSRDGGTESVAEPTSVLPEIPHERHVPDLQAVMRYLNGRPDVTRIGAIGMCFGGAITWLLATVSKELAAAVPFYGSNPPLEDVPNIRAAVFGVYGDLDERINKGIPEITSAMKAAGATFEIKMYAKADHAFHNPSGGGRGPQTEPERYNPQAAKEAWADALAWFDRHLKG